MKKIGGRMPREDGLTTNLSKKRKETKKGYGTRSRRQPLAPLLIRLIVWPSSPIAQVASPKKI